MKKIIGLTILTVLAVAIWLNAETVPQTQSVLRSYFQTGLRPTQTNYWEFIDTMYWYANQTYTNALLAQQQLGQMQSLYQGYTAFTLTVGTAVTPVYTSRFNVASVTVTNAHASVSISGLNNNGGSTVTMNEYICNVVYSNSLAGTNYNVTFSAPGCVKQVPGGLPGNSVVRLDGFGCGNVLGYTYTTTNFLFYFMSNADANFNGLNVAIILQ